MSRIGKQEIIIPTGVTVEITGGILTVKGQKGELKKDIKDEIRFNIIDGKITSEPIRNDKFSRALWGTYMSHLKNMIKGVQEGFTKKLLIEGVGHKWEVKGEKLQLNIGFSHLVFLDIPKGISVIADKVSLVVSGINKEAVASFAMVVRKQKTGEPYKGKGIRYFGEILRRKQGKKSA